jgi:hypothetical protein
MNKLSKPVYWTGGPHGLSKDQPHPAEPGPADALVPRSGPQGVKLQRNAARSMLDNARLDIQNAVDSKNLRAVAHLLIEMLPMQ